MKGVILTLCIGIILATTVWLVTNNSDIHNDPYINDHYIATGALDKASLKNNSFKATPNSYPIYSEYTEFPVLNMKGVSTTKNKIYHGKTASSQPNSISYNSFSESEKKSKSHNNAGGGMAFAVPSMSLMANSSSNFQTNNSLLPSANYYNKINTEQNLVNILDDAPSGPGILPPADGDGDDDLIELPVKDGFLAYFILIMLYMFTKLIIKRKR